MTHTYQVTGMTCSGCEAKVKSSLLIVPNITAVTVSKESNTAIITMDKHIALQDLQKALGGSQSKYQLSVADHIDNNKDDQKAFENEVAASESWLDIYKPILLIFAYITTISAVVAFNASWMVFMQYFMAGFFLVFSFFKMLNLKSFAESYAMYDIVAKQFNKWGFIYAFIEVALGLAYLINFNPFITNIVTIIIMGISIIGVLQSVLNKRKIQCACLGTVFNLPMSTVTIVEDGLMIAMSGIMLATMI